MYLKKVLRLRSTLVFRLTLWYAAIFLISSFVVFLAIYLSSISLIREDTDQGLLNELTEFSGLMASEDLDAVKKAALLEAESEGIDKMFYRIFTMRGDLLSASDMSYWGDIGIGRTPLKKLGGSASATPHAFETLAPPEHKHEARILYAIIGPETVLQIGFSLKESTQFFARLKKIFITTMPILLVFAALIGWFMSRRALQGVEEVTRTAEDISKGALGQRVHVKAKGDEIERLATTFNHMLDRIEVLIEGMRELTDNIAHDLRSPITRIRGINEMALNTGKSMNEYNTMAANTIKECDRLLEMVNTMLDISETEAGASKLEMEKTDMAELVRDACELFQPSAEEKMVTLISEISDNAFVHGDIQRIQRMVINLLDNALKYTLSGGTVTVSVYADERQAVVSVKDTGIGISKQDLPHIFNRFYRCDQSRSQAGLGLGLSLAMVIARAHDGNITATSSLGKGSKFTITLPQNSNPRQIS